MNTGNIEKELAEYISALTGTEAQIVSETKLADIGMDSISLVKTFVFVERHFGVSLINAGLEREQIETLGALAAHISSNMQKEG